MMMMMMMMAAYSFFQYGIMCRPNSRTRSTFHRWLRGHLWIKVALFLCKRRLGAKWGHERACMGWLMWKTKAFIWVNCLWGSIWYDFFFLYVCFHCTDTCQNIIILNYFIEYRNDLHMSIKMSETMKCVSNEERSIHCHAQVKRLGSLGFHLLNTSANKLLTPDLKNKFSPWHFVPFFTQIKPY